MKNLIRFTIALFISLTLSPVASAGLVRVDFNDLSVAPLLTQGGGTGLSGTWAGTGTLNVLNEDLAAPTSTNFALTQSGNTRNMRGDFDGSRADKRSLSFALTDNEMWFSFLLRQEGTESRAGIEFNPTLSGTGVSGFRVVGVGSSLRVIGAGGDFELLSAFDLGQTALVLGQINVADVGNETLSIWIDPDVEALGAADAVVSDRNFIGTSGLTALGVESYRSGGTSGGTVDLISISDRSRAYLDVTGLPAPAALPAGLLFLASIAARRRRRR